MRIETAALCQLRGVTMPCLSDDELEVQDMELELKRLKKERKKIKKEFGKVSYEYVEITEEIETLKNFIDFQCLHIL